MASRLVEEEVRRRRPNRGGGGWPRAPRRQAQRRRRLPGKPRRRWPAPRAREGARWGGGCPQLYGGGEVG